MRRFEISDEQFQQIAHLLPGKPGDPGVTAKDNKLFLEAVLWIARTGAPWSDLPPRFGKFDTAFQRFNRWAKKGVWTRILQALGNDPDLNNLLIDSTSIRAHRHAAGAQKKTANKRWDGLGAA